MKIPKKLILFVILASAGLTVMAGSMLSPIVNLIREELAVDPASAGIILTTHSLFVALFSPVMGILVDKIGTRRPLMFSLLVYGLAGGAGLFINSFWLFIASRALLGIAVAAAVNAVTVTILNIYDGAERNKVMGWRGSAASFGAMLFPLLGGALGSLSWHLPFAVYLVGIPLGFLVFITMPETRREKSQDTGEKVNIWRVFKNNPILFGVYGLSLLTTILLYTNMVYLPQLLETIGISNPFHISLFFTAGSLASALTAVAYGKIKSRLSYKAVALIVLALWTVGLTLISQVSSASIIAASAVLVGIGRGMVLPALPVWVGETVPTSFRGRIIAYLTTLGYVGQFSAPILFSPVFLLVGFSGVFLVAAGTCAVVFVLFLVLMRK